MSAHKGQHSDFAVTIEDCFTPGHKPGVPAVSAVLEGWLRPGWFGKAHTDATPISVLMVHGEQSPLRALSAILSEQFCAEVTRVCNCQEAAVLLEQAAVPHVIFTDTKLPDGSWQDILRITKTASQPVNAFVVSLVGNIVLYTEVMTQGAFDFITPNIPPAAFVEVLRSAVEDVNRRRSRRRAA